MKTETKIVKKFGMLYMYLKLKQRLKSACEFYLRYKDKPELLIKEYPEYKEELDEEGWWFSSEYNNWLFKLAFKDVFKEEK